MITEKLEIKKAQDVVRRQEMWLDRTTPWWRHMVLSSYNRVYFAAEVGVIEWGQINFVF
jgi:hypothetical protein